jgi:hypothetical protein
LFSLPALSNPSYNKPIFAMLVYMTKNDNVPDALCEGSNKSDVLISVKKQIRKQQALHASVIKLFATMASGVDALDSRIENRLDRLEEKLDSLVGEK